MAAESLSPWYYSFMALIAVAPIALTAFRLHLDSRLERESRAALARVEAKALQQPEVVGYAWDVARRKLEAYFDRNLSQVKSIFWVSVFVMSVGSLLIMFGVLRSFLNPASINSSYVSVASGIVTEFISLTFMVIYRSTLKQASSYMSVLEQINSVGMAVQILDAIDSEERELKNKTRAEIVKLLLRS